MSEFAKLREELAKSRPLEFVGRDCACIGCIAHREIGLILRALAIAELGEDVERALENYVDDCECGNKAEQQYDGTWSLPAGARCAHCNARATISKLKQAREV